MAFQTIHAAALNFPANLLTLEEDTAEPSNSDWIAINGCDYAAPAFSIDPIWETDVDE